MIEGSGSIPLTNGSGSGSGRLKNMLIRWIRIRNSDSYINYIYLPNRQPGDGIGNVCAARQAVTGVQPLARVAGQRGVPSELVHRKYVLVLGFQVVDHA